MSLGKIKADTIEHSTAGSLDTKFVVNGSAKMYAERTDAATPATTSSFNVASLTDTGTGNTGYNLTAYMDDDDAPVAGTNSSTSGDFGVLSRYASTSQVQSITRNSSGTDTDRRVSIIGLGDLA